MKLANEALVGAEGFC